MKVLIVGDDNFTFTPCLLENQAQWVSKCQSETSAPCDENLSSSSLPATDSNWQIEVACSLAASKVPVEFQGDLNKLQQRGIPVHFSVNPALLRQYFPAQQTAEPTVNDRPGPPYDVVLFVLPGLQYEGCPRYIEKSSELFKLRLQLFWFALAKSSTVIAKPNGRVMFLWIDQTSIARQPPILQTLPFPLLDIHKLGPFCKIFRDASEDFRLNLSWGDYKLRWKPLIHNVELLQFPKFLEELKVYCFRNSPYIPPANPAEAEPPATGPMKPNEDFNLLRIPQSICQWDRTVLPHVNELFHFNMRTCVPGEMLQISKLSVKYDPRITGWRNSGVARPAGPIQPASSPQGMPVMQAPQQMPPPMAGGFPKTWARFESHMEAVAQLGHVPAPAATRPYGAATAPYGQANPAPTSMYGAPTPVVGMPDAVEAPPAYETGAYDPQWSAYSAGYWPPLAQQGPPLSQMSWSGLMATHQPTTTNVYEQQASLPLSSGNAPASGSGSEDPRRIKRENSPQAEEHLSDQYFDNDSKRSRRGSNEYRDYAGHRRGSPGPGRPRRSPSVSTGRHEEASMRPGSLGRHRQGSVPRHHESRSRWEDDQRYGPQRRQRREPWSRRDPILDCKQEGKRKQPAASGPPR